MSVDFDNPLVSVIVPVYKVEKYICRCLDSLLSQTYKNLEIILVDDGSPDNSGKICDEYKVKDNRIQVIHKENGGVSSARNEGLRVANGNYIGFVDSDDYIAPQMYETLVNNAFQYDADISICGFYDEANGEFSRYCSEDMVKVFLGDEQLECLLKNKYYSCSIWDRIYKKEILSGIEFNENITNYEDLLFLWYVTNKSSKTIFASEPFYYYATNEGSAAVSSFSKKKMTMIDVCETILCDAENNHKSLYNVARTEFVRNNLMCAGMAARDGYSDKDDIKRLKRNVSKNLWFYTFSYAAKGYKLYAYLLSISWKLFKLVKNIRT